MKGNIKMEFDIVRAWKDARYRQSLTSEQQAMLPENPAGICELTEADLETVQGSFGGSDTGSMSVGNCIFSLSPNSINSCDTFAGITGVCTSGNVKGNH
jgi:mersacidin/lichenicidin family type 2 lantibiotic